MTVALAGMLIVSPVRGLRPVRAARFTFWNEMKPGIEILSPLATCASTVSVIPLMTSSTVDFAMPVRSAIASISSALFIGHLPRCGQEPGQTTWKPHRIRGFLRVFSHRACSGLPRGLAPITPIVPSKV